MSTVAKEVAEAEFERFTTAMDLDVDPARMDADDRKNLEEARHTIVRAIERGQLIVDEKGQPVLTPTGEGAKPITFYEPTGASYMSADAHKKTAEAAKLCAMLGDVTRTNAKTFASMPVRDFKICQKILALFLG